MRSSLFYFLLFVLVSLFGSNLHAEGGCPPGMEPEGGQGVSSCRPISGYSNNQAGQQVLQAPPPQWESEWMAFATDSTKGSLGIATDMPSREIAEHSALANCQAKGGTHCELDVSYGNGCAAMIVGDGGYNSNGAATADEAIRLGMKACSNAGHNNCHVYYTACSLPKQIQ